MKCYVIFIQGLARTVSLIHWVKSPSFVYNEYLLKWQLPEDTIPFDIQKPPNFIEKLPPNT